MVHTPDKGYLPEVKKQSTILSLEAPHTNAHGWRACAGSRGRIRTPESADSDASSL